MSFCRAERRGWPVAAKTSCRARRSRSWRGSWPSATRGDRGDHHCEPHFKKAFGPVELSEELRVMVREAIEANLKPPVRLHRVLGGLGIARSSWYVRRA